ncbi:MAG: PSP1 domain-containing protein [Thermodesulfobacteriota bacterium]
MRVVAVKFKERGKTYLFECGELALQINDWVMVETEKGLAMASVVVEPWEIEPDAVRKDIRKVARLAGKDDLVKAQRLKERELEARRVCRDLIQQYQLPMKLVEVESLFEPEKMIFSFTAENRVDFRRMVKELARRFHCKVEMRQIGVRNEAKVLGGLGSCGRELCCCSFLTEFEPVSVKMAKDQNLSLNPLKISGLCGRLMCCLAFEHKMYLNLKEGFPSCRKWVNTRRGVGRVKRLNVLADRVVLETPDGQEVEVHLDEILEVLPGKPTHLER